MWVSTKKRGFTVVELLIVVVVIAILSTITVVSYQGARTKAQNTRVIATVKNYADVLNAYHLANNQYPNVGGDHVCLPANYPATAEFPLNSCEYDGGSYLNFVSPASSTNIVTELATVERSLPDASYGYTLKGFLGGSTERVRGILFTDEGIAGGGFIIYHLKGESKCPLGTPQTGVGTSAIECWYGLQ